MLRLFICYRRDDSAGHAGRLMDALASSFGNAQVLMDIDTIEPGVAFDDVIQKTLDNCDVVIAVIGRTWLTSTDASGRRRLDNPDDFVRLELETALQRNIPLIPVLVQGANMPSPNELPAGLGGLARRHALHLGDSRWRHDVDALVRSLEHIEQRLAEGAISAVPGEEPEAPAVTVATAVFPGHAFVSYSSEDRLHVLAFVDLLRRHSVPIWIDDGDIDAALLWGEVIVEAIEQCTAFVLMLSESAATSQHVVRELVLASEFSKPILPLFLEPMDVPRSMRYQLAGIQRIDLFHYDEEENLRRVLRSLHRVGLPSSERSVVG